ncbi:site-specific integrase [Methyloversatilis universalis]|uniref:site-specific integrase n=1 Tax=Methyloversatilis universalis TaxID=378211 RepID=UPI0003651364|nr:site-specific integrase [Methyloversatilis universalis]
MQTNEMPTISWESRSGHWRVTINVPKDLQAQYDGQKQFKKTIRIADRGLADVEATEWALGHARRFAALRSPDSADLFRDSMPEEEAGYYAREWVRRWIDSDENGRLLQAGVSEHAREADEWRLADLEQATEEAISAGSIWGDVSVTAERALRELGFRLDRESLAFRVFCLRLAEALQTGIQITRKRWAGRAAPTPQAEPKPPVRLGYLVDEFIKRKLMLQGETAMMKKYRFILPAMVEYIGDKLCTDLKQNDLISFSDDLCRLPWDWWKARKQGVSIRSLLERDHPKRVAKDTFEGSYKAAIAPFLDYAKLRYGDAGFPQHLSASVMEYLGERVESEENQRAMTQEELKRLFEGEEARAFAGDPEQVQRYWFPLVGLYTGARVREVCQLNPQKDIREEGGIWFFHITDQTEAAEGVQKSTKNASSRRKVVIHSKLIELGFIRYVEAIRQQGAKVLFPMWKPKGGNPSEVAGEWFRGHLMAIGLRDETGGAMLTGYHAFRHTFSTRARDLGIEKRNLITGHTDEGTTTVQRGYERGDRPLAELQALVEGVGYDLVHPVPVCP